VASLQKEIKASLEHQETSTEAQFSQVEF